MYSKQLYIDDAYNDLNPLVNQCWCIIYEIMVSLCLSICLEISYIGHKISLKVDFNRALILCGHKSLPIVHVDAELAHYDCFHDGYIVCFVIDFVRLVSIMYASKQLYCTFFVLQYFLLDDAIINDDWLDIFYS